ncbi:hypothetical protein D9M68_983850 [compost metagenome]
MPGLINAYKTASIEALQASEIIIKTINSIYEISFDYIATNQVMRVIKDEQLKIINQEFDNQCKIKFEVRKAQLNVVLGKFEKIEATKLTYLDTV